MKLFRIIALGTLKAGYSLESLKKLIAENYHYTKIVTYSVEQLSTGEVLFVAVSQFILEIQPTKDLTRLLNMALDASLNNADIFMDEPEEKYFACFNTHILVPGRGEAEDLLNSRLWELALEKKINIEYFYSAGYLYITVVTDDPLEKSIRQEIRVIAESVYPGTFVFENPILPKE